MARRGRSNAEMLARMARILGLLRAAPSGLTTEDLLERVGYGDGPRASRMRTLHRDLSALAADGWLIETKETANTPALRVLRTVDNRFATLFTVEERAQLARAAACAGPEVVDALVADLGRSTDPPPFVATGMDGLGRLSVCQTAATDRCTLGFTYNGSLRTTHPIRVLLRPGGWYLSAVDTGDDLVKQFSIDRMRTLHKGQPGTAAQPPDSPPEPVWDLMRKPVHDPIAVTVETSHDFLFEVLSALASNGHEMVDSPDPGDLEAERVRLEVTVTNTDALLVRLIELGTRVRLIGPPDVGDQLRDRLIAAGGAS